MQIWKFRYPENFAFLIQRILQLFVREFVNFLKSRLIFNIFYCFWMFVNKLFTFSRVHISENKTCLNVKSSAYYLHMKTKILPDFWICISVPNITSQTLKILEHRVYMYSGIYYSWDIFHGFFISIQGVG